MSWLGESVLVTGGAGFIGSHLVEELLWRGARQVTVIDNNSANLRLNLDAGPVVIDHNDVRDHAWSRLNRFDVIFHFAANAYVPPSVENPVVDYEINCTSTLTLLDTLRRLKWPGRLIFASSAAVYGNPTWSPVREDHPTVPVSPYGCGKLAAERYCEVFAELYGLNIASLRIFSCYGPRQRKQVIYDLMCKIAVSGPSIQIHGDGTQVRDFTYVTDVVQAAMIAAEKAPLKGEVYNVGSGCDATVHEVATELCALLGASPKFDYTGINRPGDPEKLAVDTSRLRTLGYDPKVGLKDGLAATVDWFKGSG